MDILAHALWTGVGLVAWHRKRVVSRQAASLTVSLAVLPDLVHMLPVTLWAAISGHWATWLDFALATPPTEPDLPLWVAHWSHHLHCALHSAVVALAVTALVWVIRRAFWLPLAGWWLHIVIDVFTHSADFYPVPVLYPITYAGFDGIAWNTPWLMALNYVALLVAGLFLWRR
ncbi:MAG: hypothetical protein RLZZ126_1619 [Pseudomonadota bacterium]|jgi:hypothetical protein